MELLKSLCWNVNMIHNYSSKNMENGHCLDGERERERETLLEAYQVAAE